MSDSPKVPRYTLRQRTALGTPVRNPAASSNAPPSTLDLPPPGIHSPAEDGESSTDRSATIPTILVQPATPTSPETPSSPSEASLQAQAQAQPKQQPPPPPPPLSDVRSKLKINTRTFYGPLLRPRQSNEDPDETVPSVPYALFTCALCPFQNASHALCLPTTHPCIWSFPPKAREAFANRNHWYAVGKSLEETRLPKSGRLPNLVDEDGEFMTRGLVGVGRGVDLEGLWDDVVLRRWRAVVDFGDLGEGLDEGEDEGYDGDEEGREIMRGLYRRAREGMLESMEWRFDW